MSPTLLLLATALSGSVLSPGQPAADAPPPADAIYFYSAGLDAAFADDKDQALLDALGLLRQRLIDLPAELDGPNGADRAIASAWDLLTEPMTFQVWSTGDPEGPPVALQLTVMPTARGAAASLRSSLAESLNQSGLRLTREGSIQRADTPAGELSLGTLQRNGGDAAFIGLNSRGDRPAPDLNFNLPDNARPVIAFRADFQSMQPFMDALLQAVGPEAAQMQASFESIGLLGPDALIIEGAAGYTHDQTVGLLRYHGLRRVITDPDAAAFGKDHLRAIPQDAVWLSIATFDHAAFDRAIAGQEDPFEQLEPLIGVNLRTDLLDHLGRRVSAYRSDSTGGGGMLSTVVILDLADPGAIADTHDHLVSRFNQFGAEEARGYLRIRHWNRDGLDLFTLTTPGLPLPIEVTWSIVGDRLIIAGGPRPILAAINQLKTGQPSILDNKSFAAAAGSSLDRLASIHYLDTARLAPDGYSLVSLAAASLSNAVRSPIDPDRQPEILLPSFSTLFRDVKPAVSIGRWDGDDLVIETRGDRSVLVNAAASAGTAGGLPLALAAAGIGLGAFANTAQAMAQPDDFGAGRGFVGDDPAFMQIKSQVELERISVMIQVYAADHDGQLPQSLTAMDLDADLLDSPYGPALDGGDDYALRGDLGRLDAIDAPETTILVIDRAAWLATADLVAVGFVDGHVEMLQLGDLDAVLQRPENTSAAQSMNLGW